jgi:hypothetical protein
MDTFMTEPYRKNIIYDGTPLCGCVRIIAREIKQATVFPVSFAAWEHCYFCYGQGIPAIPFTELKEENNEF